MNQLFNTDTLQLMGDGRGAKTIAHHKPIGLKKLSYGVIQACITMWWAIVFAPYWESLHKLNCNLNVWNSFVILNGYRIVIFFKISIWGRDTCSASARTSGKNHRGRQWRNRHWKGFLFSHRTLPNYFPKTRSPIWTLHIKMSKRQVQIAKLYWN